MQVSIAIGLDHNQRERIGVRRLVAAFNCADSAQVNSEQVTRHRRVAASTSRRFQSAHKSAHSKITSITIQKDGDTADSPVL
jgi:hypothetical protein